MRWLIEIIDIVANERLFTDLLTRLNLTLYLEHNKTYLTGDEFEQLPTGAEVWERAERLRDVLSTEVSKRFPGASMTFKLGDLCEQREDGCQRRHIRDFTAPVVSIVGVEGSTATFTFTQKITEEERARLEAESLEREHQEKLKQLEREYQEKLDIISSRVLPSVRDERARKVQRLLQQELTPVRMFHIYELIRADLGEEKDMNGLVSPTERSRFRLSVNHQEVFGDDSRHAALNAAPPANPMSLSEAQAFIQRVADLWFRQKC